MSTPTTIISIPYDADGIPDRAVLENANQTLSAQVDKQNGDVYLNFSSRLAMRDFAKSLLHESIYGDGVGMEFYPLSQNGEMLVVNGARLTIDSSRIFVRFNPQD